MIDLCRTKDAIILEQEADLIIQQIDILFDTDGGEVLGYPDYGADYEKFIHELNISAATMEDYITRDIQSNVDLLGWTLEVEVQVSLGELNDIILVAIKFSKEDVSYSRIYKIDHDDIY